MRGPIPKKLVASLCVLVTLAFGILVLDHSAPLLLTFTWSGRKYEQHKAYHTIILTNADEKSGCTAFAIAPHVLLTAQHCDLMDAVMFVDQPRSDLIFPTYIDKKIYDGHDHMLIVALGMNFTHFIQYNPDTYSGPTIGEAVYMWGSPRLIRDQYREGLCTGNTVLPPEDDDLAPGTPVYLFAMPVVGGDSGSAIFASDGRLVSVLTWGIQGGLFAGGYTLAFTVNQVREVKGFVRGSAA